MRKPLPKLGATGGFPEGKLNKHDEGELTFAISTENGCVRLDFGKPVAWMAFPPAFSRQLAQALIKRANEIEEVQ